MNPTDIPVPSPTIDEVQTLVTYAHAMADMRFLQGMIEKMEVRLDAARGILIRMPFNVAGFYPHDRSLELFLDAMRGAIDEAREAIALGFSSRFASALDAIRDKARAAASAALARGYTSSEIYSTTRAREFTLQRTPESPKKPADDSLDAPPDIAF